MTAERQNITLNRSVCRFEPILSGSGHASPLWKSVDLTSSNLISERERRVKPGHGIHDANFAHGLLYGRLYIRSLFPGEGNHIPRSTIMVNECSLRAVTEPLPLACTPASVSDPWVHLSLVAHLYPLWAKLLRCRNYRTTGCYLSKHRLPPPTLVIVPILFLSGDKAGTSLWTWPDLVTSRNRVGRKPAGKLQHANNN